MVQQKSLEFPLDKVGYGLEHLGKNNIYCIEGLPGIEDLLMTHLKALHVKYLPDPLEASTVAVQLKVLQLKIGLELIKIELKLPLLRALE